VESVGLQTYLRLKSFGDFQISLELWWFFQRLFQIVLSPKVLVFIAPKHCYFGCEVAEIPIKLEHGRLVTSSSRGTYIHLYVSDRTKYASTDGLSFRYTT